MLSLCLKCWINLDLSLELISLLNEKLKIVTAQKKKEKIQRQQSENWYSRALSDPRNSTLY